MEYINRTTVKESNNAYKVYLKSCPQAYKKSDGSYAAIDLTFNDTTSAIGEISLLDKNVFSVGLRKDGNPFKYMGIRPDNSQDGSKQLEFTFKGLYLDNEEQTVDLSKDCKIEVEKNSLTKFIKASKTFNDFKCEYQLDLKGMQIVNDKYEQETSIKNYQFNLTNVGIDTGSNVYKKVYTDPSNINLNRSDQYIDMYVGQMNNDFITKGQYSNEEEFGSSDLTNYSIVDMYPYGSSVYLKDSIVLYSKGYNFNDFEKCMLDALKKEFNMDYYDDGGAGKYFTINNKKVGGIAVKSDDEFLAFFNTKEIPQDIKDLFIRKSFNSTSYIDTTLNEFISKINTAFNLELDLKVDTDYYKDNSGSFEIKIANESFYIREPKLTDSNFEVVDVPTFHTLKDNGDNTYTYTKFFTVEGTLQDSRNAVYIDATLDVSQGESVPYLLAATNGLKTAARLTTVRNATTGSNVRSRLYATAGICAGDKSSKTVAQFSATYRTFHYQSHYFFDTSGISGTLDECDFKCFMAWSHKSQSGSDLFSNMEVIFVKSTASGSEHKDHWNDIDGHTSGWGASDVTEYTGEVAIDNGRQTHSSDTYISNTLSSDNVVAETIALNSTAKTDIKNNSTFKFCIMPYDQYYGDNFDSSYGATTGDLGTSASGWEWRHCGAVHHNTSLSGREPHLYYTLSEEEEAVTYNAPMLGANF